ncbi:MAG: hypothetical protein ACKO9H_10060, partial [Planctomycetota bacterium]
IADLDAGRGERRVDAAGQVEFRGEVVEGGDGAGADGGDLEGGGVLALVEFEDVIDAAEVSEDANGGFSVLAKGLDDAEVSDAVGLVGLQGSHRYFVYTIKRQEESMAKQTSAGGN